jgi:hypothetical protein
MEDFFPGLWEELERYNLQDFFNSYTQQRTSTGFAYAWLLLLIMSNLDYKNVNDEANTFLNQFWDVESKTCQILFYEFGSILAIALRHTVSQRKARLAGVTKPKPK